MAQGIANSGRIGAKYLGPRVGPAGQSQVRPEMTMICNKGTAKVSQKSNRELRRSSE